MAIETRYKNIRFVNPYADYEYRGKRSREPWRALIWPILFGLFLFWFAFHEWQSVTAAEKTGNTVYMTTIEWWLYKVSGKNGIAILFSLFGLLFIYMGIRKYRHLEKLKKS